MQKTQRTVAIVLSMLLLCGAVLTETVAVDLHPLGPVAHAEQEDTESDGTPQPVQPESSPNREEPIKTEHPVETQKPVEGGKPISTEESAETEQPTPMEEPEDDIPAESENPAVTATPVETEQPAETIEPDEWPSETLEPSDMEKPGDLDTGCIMPGVRVLASAESGDIFTLAVPVHYVLGDQTYKSNTDAGGGIKPYRAGHSGAGYDQAIAKSIPELQITISKKQSADFPLSSLVLSQKRELISSGVNKGYAAFDSVSVLESAKPGTYPIRIGADWRDANEKQHQKTLTYYIKVTAAEIETGSIPDILPEITPELEPEEETQAQPDVKPEEGSGEDTMSESETGADAGTEADHEKGSEDEETQPNSLGEEAPEGLIDSPLSSAIDSSEQPISNQQSGDAYYTVKFMVEGHELMVQLVKERERLALPQSPAKEASVFLYWTNESGEPFDTDTPVERDLVLTAKYRAIGKHTVVIRYLDESGAAVADDVVREYTDAETDEDVIDSPYVRDMLPDQPSVVIQPGEIVEEPTVITVRYYNANTRYTVQHWFESMDGGYEHDVHWDEEKLGLRGTQATAKAHPDAEAQALGFQFSHGTAATIDADGSTVVCSYYARATNFIVYDAQGGAPLMTSAAKYGHSVLLPDNTRTGFNFAGWYFDAGCTSFAGGPNDSYSMPAARRTTLYAKWIGKLVDYTVVHWVEAPNISGSPDPRVNPENYRFYSKQAGLKAIAGMQIAENTAATIPICDNERYNIQIADFVYSEPATVSGDGTTVINVYYNLKSFQYVFTVTGGPLGANRSMTIGGKTYNSNGSGSGKTYTLILKYNQYVKNIWPVYPNASFSGTTYKFISWDTDIPGVGAWMTNRMTITAESLPKTGSVVKLSTKWANVVLVSTFKANYYFQLYPGQPILEKTKSYGGITYIWDPEYYMELNGEWIDFSGLSGKAIEGMLLYEEPSGQPAWPITSWDFYYLRLNYSLSFNTQGGADYEADPATQLLMFGEPMAGYRSTAWKEGATTRTVDGIAYTFGGWYTTAECYDGTKADLGKEMMPAHNLELFAKWVCPKISVQPVLNYSGAPFLSPIVIDAGTPVGPQLPSGVSLIRDGYVFDGWYSDAECTQPYPVDQPTTTNVSLYGGWRELPVSYTVHYLDDATGSELLESKEVDGQRPSSKVTEKATSIPGYRPDDGAKTITLGIQISDRITVMRDGQYVGTRAIKDVTKKELVTMMVGRELTESFPSRNVPIGDTILEVRDLCGNGDFHINLQLKQGEILGLGGLVGAGRTELAKMLYGDVRPDSGEIRVHGRPVKFRDTSQAIDAGIGLVPEDRKKEGTFLNYTIDWNIPAMSLKHISKFGMIDFQQADRLASEYSDRLRIKTPSLKQVVRNLSGGNQQKVVVAKVLAAKTSIIIFDEPTRGIDVGAKQEIYRLMNELVEAGMSIIMISSEMEELLGMSDRICVLYEGKLAGELTKEEFSQERVLELASGM